MRNEQHCFLKRGSFTYDVSLKMKKFNPHPPSCYVTKRTIECWKEYKRNQNVTESYHPLWDLLVATSYGNDP